MNFAPTDDLGREIAERALDALAPAQNEGREAGVALTGGSTPRAYLPALFALPLDWRRIVLTLADDRLVPPAHPDSNAGLIEAARAGTPAAAARFVPLATRFDDPFAAAAEAGQRLPRLVPWPLDLAILGMGEDGHIASLFPELKPDLSVQDICVGVGEAPPPNRHPRVSLSLEALLSARIILLAVTGASKRAALERALALPDGPLGMLAERAGARLCIVAAP